MIKLPTPRLTLVLKTRDECLAMVEALEPDGRAQVSSDWLARLNASTDPDPWVHGFTITLLESGAKIGECGFKAPPDADGMIEVAYGIDPDHQGKGFATEAARGLVQFASGHSEVKTIRAHTCPRRMLPLGYSQSADSDSSATSSILRTAPSGVGKCKDPEVKEPRRVGPEGFSRRAAMH